MFRNLIGTVLPSIAYSEEFHIPRLFTEFIKSKGSIKIP